MKVWTFRIGFNQYAACPVTKGRHPNAETIKAGRRIVGEGGTKQEALNALAALLQTDVSELQASAVGKQDA